MKMSQKSILCKDETAIEDYLDAALSIGADFSYELDNGSFFY